MTTTAPSIQELQRVIEAVASPVGILIWRADGSLSLANARAEEIVGRAIPLESSVDAFIAAVRLLRAGSPELYPSDMLVPASVFGGQATVFGGAELDCPDGRKVGVEGWTSPVRAADGTIPFAMTIVIDVTARRSNEALRAGEARVLEMVAADKPLHETLDTLARVFEAQADGMLASILLVEDGVRVRHAAAPSLPREWASLVDGEPIGPNRGSCGTAAHLGEPVIVTDIATDPRWEPYRDAALRFGFRACWSTPIFGPDKVVLGTFAFYYFEPREPTPSLLRLAAHASRLATIAIQRHRNREALLASERHLSLVYNHSADVLFQLQVEPRGYRFVSANPAFGAATGLDPRDIVGKSIDEVIPEPSLSLVRARYDEAIRTGQTVRWEETTEYPSGTRHGDVAITPVLDDAGRATHLIGSVRDVTERRNIDRERHQLREREQLQAVLDQAPTAVAISRGNRVLYFNSKLADVYGLRAGDDLRTIFVSSEERAQIAGELANGHVVVDREIQLHDVAGQTRDVLATFHPIDVGGQPSVIEYLVDITQIKTVERRLHRAKEAAEAATRAKSLFLANMSHEIRTPLNAILGYAQLLQRDTSLGPAQKYRIDAVHASGRHLLMLISDILEMSKIEAGRTTLLVEPFDLHALLGDIRLMFAELTAAKGIELDFDLEPDLANVVAGDAGKVRQVVINLLSNGLKFTDRGRVRLRAASTPAAADRHLVRITVQDTGIGIEPDDRDRIFGAFDQSDSGVRSGGTGLGLAISRHFARLMGGDLTVNSSVGRGSTFTFVFGAGSASAADVPVHETGPVPTGLLSPEDSRRVLIVDDVATNRELLEDLLSRIGFEIRMAWSGEEALRVGTEWQPHLILMDLRMPGMGGCEAIRRLRAQGVASTIFAVTASGLSETEQEALAAGADAFLRKPYSEHDLLARVGRALRVRYAYDNGTPTTTQPSDIGVPTALSEALREMPPALVAQLRDAALQGRSSRLERLAEQVGEHSEAGAAQVRLLAREFRYDALIDAIDKEGPPS